MGDIRHSRHKDSARRNKGGRINRQTRTDSNGKELIYTQQAPGIKQGISKQHPPRMASDCLRQSLQTWSDTKQCVDRDMSGTA
ncbi:MAG: hypothetical protein U0K35_07135, partial [Prevotella sp.]|nr:hypothetical protein [Prevotella sp.]